jgi:hypothetical protein
VLNDPAGREKLLALGVRNVPVVAKGTQFVFAQNLEDVAEFLGMQGTGHVSLPPGELIRKWVVALRAGQRYIRQVPDARLNERAIDNRDRSIRMVGHHVFRIGEAFLETVVDGVEYTIALIKNEPGYRPLEEGTFMTGDEIARYGETVISRLQEWWDGLDDKACERKVKTYFGMQSIFMLYERSTWHSAQHARQLAAVLERFGIEPDGRLTAEDLAGLPLPERLWD